MKYMLLGIAICASLTSNVSAMLGHVARTGTRVLAPALTTSGSDIQFARRLHMSSMSENINSKRDLAKWAYKGSKINLKESSKAFMLNATALPLGLAGLSASRLLNPSESGVFYHIQQYIAGYFTLGAGIGFVVTGAMASVFCVTTTIDYLQWQQLKRTAARLSPPLHDNAELAPREASHVQ